MHTHRSGIDHGVLAALAVLLIACPCGLGLATPMAVWAALGTASRAGVLFRDGEALERLATIRAVRFDKTGTLTTGVSQVRRFIVADPKSARRGAAPCRGLGRRLDALLFRGHRRFCPTGDGRQRGRRRPAACRLHVPRRGPFDAIRTRRSGDPIGQRAVARTRRSGDGRPAPTSGCRDARRAVSRYRPSAGTAACRVCSYLPRPCEPAQRGRCRRAWIRDMTWLC